MINEPPSIVNSNCSQALAELTALLEFSADNKFPSRIDESENFAIERYERATFRKTAGDQKSRGNEPLSSVVYVADAAIAPDGAQSVVEASESLEQRRNYLGAKTIDEASVAIGINDGALSLGKL
jgi:hypothetical protein